MNPRAVLGVAATDLRRRARSPTYLLVPLLVAALAGALTGGDTQLRVGGGYTPVPNAAAYGGIVATFGTLALAIVGVSLVRGRVREDRDRGVGTLVATAPVSDAAYLTGRWLGYVATLAAVVTVMALATIASFLQHGTGPLDARALLSPFAFVALPTMAAVAGVAVLSETTRLFRGSLGTAAYFFGLLALVSMGQNPSVAPLDPIGAAVVRGSMLEAIPGGVSGAERLEFALGSPRDATAFTWDGVDWTPGTVLGRAPLVGVGALALGVAVLRFDRFGEDPGPLARLRAVVPGRRGVLSLDSADGGAADSDVDTGPSHAEATDVSAGSSADASAVRSGEERVGATLATLAPATGGTPSLLDPRVVAAECRLALRGHRWWWYGALVAVVVAGLLAPPAPARALVVPVAFLLPLSVWSDLGTREARHRTAELVFATPRPTGQLLAAWASGAVVALLAASGALVTLALAGDAVTVAAVLVAAAGVPAVAFALGVWTGTGRTFETVYLVAWYLGPLNGVGPLDFLGATGTHLPVTAVLAGLAVLALVAAARGRSRVDRA